MVSTASVKSSMDARQSYVYVACVVGDRYAQRLDVPVLPIDRIITVTRHQILPLQSTNGPFY